MPLFTNSQLGELQLKAEEIMADGNLSDQYIAHAEAAKAVKSNQTIKVDPVSDPAKDRTVLVTYIDTCAIQDEDCPTNFCDFTSPEIATKKKEFELSLCRRAGYSVDENDVAKSIYGMDDAVPKGQIAAKNKLDEYISRQVLIALNANAGTNEFPSPYTFDAANKTTNIAASEYNRKIVPYFEKVAMMHQIADPYYIDNGTLWVDWRNAQLDAGNADGRGDKARIDAVKMYFDMWNFATANITPDSTFMVGRHAAGIAHKAYHDPVMKKNEFKSGIQWRYKEESNNLPGIFYDVFYQLDCSGRRAKHSWMYVFTGGVFIQPEGCKAGVTGIMSFSANNS